MNIKILYMDHKSDITQYVYYYHLIRLIVKRIEMHLCYDNSLSREAFSLQWIRCVSWDECIVILHWTSLYFLNSSYDQIVILSSEFSSSVSCSFGLCHYLCQSRPVCTCLRNLTHFCCCVLQPILVRVLIHDNLFLNYWVVHQLYYDHLNAFTHH